ncbi:Non-hemolytic phospholipase C [Lecanosticta acicola]|uniref:Non-hemolytic phospholipase C n=1 Tax=Lecanosticta acicola TaxID=111012 RepID=A0AAI8Z2X2_9PEZI|nr:Non-hemolytic phospholipase C [Lecanosticta acicola]
MARTATGSILLTLLIFSVISCMVFPMSPLTKTSLAALTLASTACAGSIADIEHVVLLMQENRAFDHYFGTLAGVRNFNDPNVKVNGDTPVWAQNVGNLTTKATSLLPWYLNYMGGSSYESTQCMEAGSNGWSANHAALNGDANNNWPVGNTPWSWAHFERRDIPNHFAIAEGFTVGDMYMESVIASTNPNRVSWVSGTINVQPGSPASPDAGGVYIDNNETPGCEGDHLNCYPLKWKTTPEYLQDMNVTWQVYQDSDNFDDNPLAWFQQYQKASNSSQLAKRGLAYNGLEKFYEDAAAGKLPQVSYIVGPAELSEHQPYQPRDGAWLQQKIVDVVTQSPSYKNTVLMISYDESGGWGDHVVPIHSPNGTAGEWMQDPYGQYGYTYSGPGFRLPFYIISPWTRGGSVYVEPADHSSQILFLEKWLAAKGKNFTSAEMNPWRRRNMADLTNAFDFEHPDYSIPQMPNASYPSTDSKGNWNGYSVCQATYGDNPRPVVPYGAQNESTALATEQGFKSMRGNPTEGRYLTFEMNGYALTHNANGSLTASPSTAKHDSKTQRFILLQGSASTSSFAIISAVDGRAINSAGDGFRNSGGSWQGKYFRGGDEAAAVESYTIRDLGMGRGYSIQNCNGEYLSVDLEGRVQSRRAAGAFGIFSVSYDS